MQLYELEKRLTMDVKALAKEHDIDMKNIYINVQTSKNAMGNYSAKRWKIGEEYGHELALNPEYFSDPLEVVDTILHELVHIYCAQKGINDTSRHGVYHNQKFKKVAEDFGLVCIATEKNGWNTSAAGNREKLDKINKGLPYPITCDMVRRGESTRKPVERQERKKTHVYTCPGCGAVVKHKNIVLLTCHDNFHDNFMEIDGEDPMKNEWKDKLEEWRMAHA